MFRSNIADAAVIQSQRICCGRAKGDHFAQAFRQSLVDLQLQENDVVRQRFCRVACASGLNTERSAAFTSSRPQPAILLRAGFAVEVLPRVFVAAFGCFATALVRTGFRLVAGFLATGVLATES